MDDKNKIDIPFGAKDSELKGWEYTIPEGMEATIKDGKVIVREKESEDERIRKIIYKLMLGMREEIFTSQDETVTKDKVLAYLEKQKEQSITANDLDEEIHRFFDDCIDVHEAKLYGNISERVIPMDCYELTARHFAKWGEKQKEQKPTDKSHINWSYLEEYPCSKEDAYEVIENGDATGLRRKKQNPDGKAMLHVAEKSYQIGLRDGKMEQKPEPFSFGHENGSSEKPNNQWSEEDEKMLNRVLDIIDAFGTVHANAGKVQKRFCKEYMWLKSLRPSWKPSEEQVRALKYVAYHLMPDENYREEMFSLYEQLKKL